MAFPALPRRRAGSSVPWSLRRPHAMGQEPLLCPGQPAAPTAPHAKATPSCPPWAPKFARRHVLSSSSHPGQHPRGLSSAVLPVPLGQETQPRGQLCPELLSLPHFSPSGVFPALAPMHVGVCRHRHHRVLLCPGLRSLPVTPSSLWQRGCAGEAAPCRGSKKTFFPAKFLDTFLFTQLRLEKHQGPRDFPPCG